MLANVRWHSLNEAGNRLSLSGLDPVPLSKMGTDLLASLGSKGKNRSLACLKNAGSHSAESDLPFPLHGTSPGAPSTPSLLILYMPILS